MLLMFTACKRYGSFVKFFYYKENMKKMREIGKEDYRCDHDDDDVM